MSEISRRGALVLAGAASAATTAKAATEAKRTYVVCHGAWGAGWAWKKMRPLLHRPPAQQLFTPSYTGLGERAHLASPDITLDTHIADVVGVLEAEDLSDVTLIAHSYGGMVGTGVADRARGRVRRLIYVDAFVPEPGQALWDITGQRPQLTDWRVQPNPVPPDTSPADAAWMNPRRTPQPAKTFSTPLKLSPNADLPPRAYILCTRTAPGDFFTPMARRARERGWPTREIDSSHNAHVNAPQRLAELIDDLCRAT